MTENQSTKQKVKKAPPQITFTSNIPSDKALTDFARMLVKIMS